MDICFTYQALGEPNLATRHPTPLTLRRCKYGARLRFKLDREPVNVVLEDGSVSARQTGHLSLQAQLQASIQTSPQRLHS